MAGFFSHLRVEHDLELEIAELVGERVHVVASDRVGDFISFLDRIRGDGLEVCARSHSQPLTGSRRRRMIATRRSSGIGGLEAGFGGPRSGNL